MHTSTINFLKKFIFYYGHVTQLFYIRQKNYKMVLSYTFWHKTNYTFQKSLDLTRDMNIIGALYVQMWHLYIISRILYYILCVTEPTFIFYDFLVCLITLTVT